MVWDKSEEKWSSSDRDLFRLHSFPWERKINHKWDLFSVSDSIISQRQQMLKSPASQMFLLRKKTSVISFMSPLVFHICQIISPDEFIYNCMAHALHFQSSGDVNELLVHVSSFQMFLNTQIIWLTLMRNAWVQMNFFLSHLFLRDSKEVRWRKKGCILLFRGCFCENVLTWVSSISEEISTMS